MTGAPAGPWASRRATSADKTTAWDDEQARSVTVLLLDETSALSGATDVPPPLWLRGSGQRPLEVGATWS
jgi:hypothetical protein